MFSWQRSWLNFTSVLIWQSTTTAFVLLFSRDNCVQVEFLPGKKENVGSEDEVCDPTSHMDCALTCVTSERWRHWWRHSRHDPYVEARTADTSDIGDDNVHGYSIRQFSLSIEQPHANMTSLLFADFCTAHITVTSSTYVLATYRFHSVVATQTSDEDFIAGKLYP